MKNVEDPPNTSADTNVPVKNREIQTVAQRPIIFFSWIIAILNYNKSGYPIS